MKNSRKLKYNQSYTPLPTFEGDEIFPNGIFHFNISRITEHISEGKLKVQRERILVQEWFKTHYHPSVNEHHLPNVNINKAIIQAEICPNMFSIIDGNHRMEKAFREGIEFIDSYKIYGEQLVPYFKKVQGYKAFVDYWNSKLKEK